jgi:CDP-glycerol glycerophosphotransferase (TagB/SpsB family)
MRSGWQKRRGYDGVTEWGVPDREDMVRYTSLMRHTDVGLAVSSTTVLEWLLCDRPVVNFCFDPDDPSRPDPVSRWMVGFTHYRFVREGPGVAFTEGLQPALDWIDRCLREPSFHAEGRRQMRQQVLGWQDGRNAERVAREVLRVAGVNVPPPDPPPSDPALLLPPVACKRQEVLV